MNPIIRNQSDISWRIESDKATNTLTGVVTDTTSRTSGNPGFSSSRNGGYLPDWKDRLLRHANATTSLSASFKDVQWEPGFSRVETISGVNPNRFKRERQTFGRHFATPGNLTWQFYNPNGSNSTATASAQAKFLSEARDSLRTFAGGPFVGELREVVQLIHSPAKAFANGMDAYVTNIKKMLKRERRSKQSHIKKRAADLWLQTVFGIKPLLSDLDSGMRALAEFTTYRQEYDYVKAESTQEYLTLNQSVQTIFFGSVAVNERRRVVETQSVRFYGQTRIGSQFPTGNIDHNQFGLGLDEFLPTMWEICPWSWLADYVFNIGDIVNAASFPYCHVAWMSKVAKGVSIYELTGLYDEKATKQILGTAYQNGYSNPGRVTFFQESVNRVAIDTRTLNTPTLRLKLNLGGTHIANILAVVAQRGKAQEKKWQGLRI